MRRRFEVARELAGHMRSAEPADSAPLESIVNAVAGDVLCATATLRDARLENPGDGVPSHAPLELLALTTAGREHRSLWLLAESWWAQTFAPPDLRQVALWLVQVLPWTLGQHFGSRVRRAWRSARSANASLCSRLAAALELIVNLALLAVSIPLTVVAEGVLLLLVLVAVLPIPWLRDQLVALQRALAGFLGDSLVLLTSPLQQAAMVAQVQRDLAWLAGRCEQVMVVAHSQGAALAHMALREERPANVRLLLTFGSGLRKLEELLQASATEDLLGGRAYLAAVGVVLLAWSAGGALLGVDWNVATTATGGLLFALVLASYMVRYSALQVSWHSLRFQAEGLYWTDVFASADPVPNGALQDYEPGLVLPQSGRIENERSVLRDHTTYWQNPEQFVGAVAAWSAQLVGEPWRQILRGQRGVWSAANKRRQWRVWALAIVRWTALASAAALVVARRCEWLELLAWLASLAASGVDKLLPGWTLPRAARPDLPTLAATAGALLGAYGLWRAARLAWSRWSEHELRVFFGRGDVPRGPEASPADSWRRLGSTTADATRFDARWFFFTFGAAEVALAVMVGCNVPSTLRTWLDASSAASIVGFVAAIVVSWAERRAIARVVERVAEEPAAQAST